MNILLLIILIFLIGILIFIEFKIFNQKKNVINKNFKDISENKIKKNNKKFNTNNEIKQNETNNIKKNENNDVVNNVKDDYLNKNENEDKDDNVKEIAEQTGVMIGRDLTIKGIEKGVKEIINKSAEKEVEKEVSSESTKVSEEILEKEIEKEAEESAEKIIEKESEKIIEREIGVLTEKEVEKEAEKIAADALLDSGEEAVTVAATEAAMGPVGWALLAFDAISIGLDIWDPEDYKSYKSNNYWNKISHRINNTWKNNIRKVNKKYLKDFKNGKKKTLIQIKDPKVVGPLDKLSKKQHQDYLKEFIKKYQIENMKDFSAEFFKTITKEKMNSMMTNYMKNTDFNKLIPNYNNLNIEEKKSVILKQFQGEDPNSPLNIEMTKYISNKLTSYMNSNNASHDMTKFLCEKNNDGRFIESGYFKGKCTYKNKTLCDESYNWNEIKTNNNGTFTQYYDNENPYHFNLKNNLVTVKDICLSAGWQAQIKKLCENNKKKDGTLEPLIYNEKTNSCDATPKYCKDYGMDYYDNEKGKYCDTNDGEKFGQFLLGSTIFKGIKREIEKNRECTTDGDCKSKFGESKSSCFNWKCKEKADLHQQCWRDSNCKSNVCISGGNKVGEKTSGAVGLCEECWKDECSSNKTCEFLKCNNKKDNEKTCVRDDSCKSNVCISFGSRVGENNAALNGVCKECETEKECGEGKACMGFKCVNKRDYRESCDRDGECKSGYVCKGLDGCRYRDGSRKYNQTCEFNPECESGKCNVKDGKKYKCSCIHDKDCGEGKICKDWTCKNKLSIGSACDRSSQCVKYNNASRCVNTLGSLLTNNGIGGTCRQCFYDSDCSGDKICQGFKCVNKKGYRESCERNSQCAGSYVCKGLDGCRYNDGSRSSDQSCAFPVECRSGKCINGKCGCNNDSECSGNKACLDFKCQSKRGVGSGCWRDSQCADDICVSAWNRINKGTAAIAGQCKQCWSNSDCSGKGYSNYKCEGYECKGKVNKTRKNCIRCLSPTGCDSGGAVWTPFSPNSRKYNAGQCRYVTQNYSEWKKI